MLKGGVVPRRARIAIAGIPWHIIQWGNNRSVCFYAEEDYQRYLCYLKEQAEKHGCLVHADRKQGTDHD